MDLGHLRKDRVERRVHILGEVKECQQACFATALMISDDTDILHSKILYNGERTESRGLGPICSRKRQNKKHVAEIPVTSSFYRRQVILFINIIPLFLKTFL